jgi:hypothetical protein
MYFGYLLQPPPPLCELARPAEWGFVYMVITGQQNKEYIIVLRCYDSQLTPLQKDKQMNKASIVR